jgi:hypothetical protein
VSKHGVDRGLISLSVLAEKPEYVGVETKRNLFLLARPTNGVSEKLGPQFRALREVDL